MAEACSCRLVKPVDGDPMEGAGQKGVAREGAPYKG